MSQHRMRPGYGSPPAPPRPPGPGASSSAFVIGGALPDKMNTVFIGSIAPGISNAVMEKLLKVRKGEGQDEAQRRTDACTHLGGRF